MTEASVERGWSMETIVAETLSPKNSPDAETFVIESRCFQKYISEIETYFCSRKQTAYATKAFLSLIFIFSSHVCL